MVARPVPPGALVLRQYQRGLKRVSDGSLAAHDFSFREAPVFNGILTFLTFVPAAVAIIPGLPLVTVILVAQSLNGILLPVILIFTLLMINNPRVMGEHVNGRVRNVIAWGFTGTLIGMSAVLLLSPLFS